jgi:dethiobiotin synthetase
MFKLIVTGPGTEVGKTVVSAILTSIFQADYWKPIECGNQECSDTEVMKTLINPLSQVHPPMYSFKAPLSPHQAARLEHIQIDPYLIIPPKTTRPLVIETAGGILVPLNPHTLTLDLFESWKGLWVIVSKHYLGSINHTLLTVEKLKQRNASILGLIFNGEPNADTEEAILHFSNLPFLGRLLPEKQININIIPHYVEQWHPLFLQLLPV